MELLRGAVYQANLGGEGDDPKLWIVVSPNGRNRNLGSALVIRVTTTPKYLDLASVVALPDSEIIHGWVRCDTLTVMWDDEPVKQIGGLSSFAMREIGRGLLAAIGLD